MGGSVNTLPPTPQSPSRDLPALHCVPTSSLTPGFVAAPPCTLHSLPALHCALGRSGASIAAHAERLRFKPASLAPHLVAALATHKASILAALIDPPLASEEARHTFTERLGIADALGMDTTPGAPAWLIALGEAMHTDAQESARNLSQGLAPSRNPSHNAHTEGR